jgi:hypothetical protein
MAVEWLPWWEWELELSPHLEKRMTDRDFSEVDLRVMLERATVFLPARTQGRWAIKTKHRGRAWKVIVEPDFARQRLVVVTAFPVTGT